MYPLRLSRLWLILGLCLVATVWFLSLTPRPPSVGIQGGDKLGHLLAYAAQMAWFGWLFRRRNHAQLGLLFLLQGGLLELMQGLSGYRVADVADMFANGLGVAAGWTLARAGGNLLGIIETWFLGSDADSSAVVTDSAGDGR